MKKLLILCCTFVTALACKEEPKDYATLSGKITNKNSSQLVVRSRTYSKTITVAEDGTFSDTLAIDTGIYNLYDGNQSTSIFLKNGFELDINLDTKAFDETIKYSGLGSEHSTFLAESTLLRERLLNIDELSLLTPEKLNSQFDDIKIELNEFYTTNSSIDTLITSQFIKQIDPMLKSYKSYILKSITLKTELAKGMTSPAFNNYKNYKGGTTSLSDLKGKYVYVDVWATWCGPCIQEIPSLKKLHTDYENKDLAIVSLSIDKMADKEKWKNMVADKNLTGTQIMADNEWQSDFVKGYGITGIPRFILIGPDGKIVNNNAPRPSDPALRTLFSELKL